MTINLQTIDQVIAAGPFVDIWESLSQVKTPQWFPDAKFGIFTHWGLYTVPEYRNEWYSRNMYIEGYPEFDRSPALCILPTIFRYHSDAHDANHDTELQIIMTHEARESWRRRHMSATKQSVSETIGKYGPL